MAGVAREGSSAPSGGGPTGPLMSVLGSTNLGFFNLNKGKTLDGEGAQQGKSVHWERCSSDLRRAIIPSSFCKRLRVINTLISYEADKRGCSVNKLSAERGGLAQPLGFAESSWKMLMLPQKGLMGKGGWSPLPLWSGL